jgi:hypothetical protein
LFASLLGREALRLVYTGHGGANVQTGMANGSGAMPTGRMHPCIHSCKSLKIQKSYLQCLKYFIEPTLYYKIFCGITL